MTTKTVTLAAAIVATLAFSAAAQADGFTCYAVDEDIKIRVYNHTDAEEGTRNAAVMVVSNPSISHGSKTIARFTDANETLSNSGASYVARVDLRYNDSERGGEDIGATKLGNVKRLKLDVDFSYAEPVEDGEVMGGQLRITRRSGSALVYEMDCERHLRN